MNPGNQPFFAIGPHNLRYIGDIAANIVQKSRHRFHNCVKVIDPVEALFLIIQKHVNLCPERLEMVRPEQRTTGREALEVVHHTPVRPGHRKAANPLLINNATYQSHTGGRHAALHGERTTRPGMERMGHLNDSRRLSRQFP